MKTKAITVATKAITVATMAAVITGCMANSLPEWQSGNEIDVNVNATGVVYVASASDADGDPVNYRVEGDLPAGWVLDANTGELTAAPRQTADAPAGTTIQLVAYDNHGGHSPLTLTVNFEYSALTKRSLAFPPSGSAINLQNGEAAILLLANQPNANGAVITSATLISEDQQTHAFNLHVDGEYWQLPMLLASGQHQLNGSVQFDDGSSELIANYVLTVNQSTLQGEADSGQITSGHQVSDDGHTLYYLSETDLVRQSFVDGSTEIIWTFDSAQANYFFGVQHGEQKITVLEQKNPLFKLSSPAMNYSHFNNILPGELTIHEIDLAKQTITEQGSVYDPMLDYGPYVVDYDVKHHRFLVNLFIAGVGGSGSSSSGPNGESQAVDDLTPSLGGNVIFEIDPVSKAITPITQMYSAAQVAPGGIGEPSSTPSSPQVEDIAPIAAIDGDDNRLFHYRYDQQILTAEQRVDDGWVVNGEFTGFDNGHLVLAADSLLNNRVGAVATGVAYDVFNKLGGLYSTVYILNDGVVEFKTECNTRAMGVFNWQSPIVQPYPAGCINGVAYDLTVLPERDFAVVSAINALNLPLELGLDDADRFVLTVMGQPEDTPSIMQSVQAISLISGQVVTLYTGY